MASVSLLVVFPFLMAYAAVRDLLTMLIPNTVSVALVVGFAVFAVATGIEEHNGYGVAFIEATRDTPYLQIGEHKYGKPILDRVVTPDTSLADEQKAVLLSMDSTLRSNLSVGMPLDLAIIEQGACAITTRRRILDGDADFARMSAAWSAALRDSFVKVSI